MANPGQGATRPKPVVLQQLSISAMSDALEPQDSKNTAGLIYNAYPLNSKSSRRLVGRPGVQHIGNATSGLGQLAFQYRKLDGTTYTVLIIKGLMYTVNWATMALTSIALPGWLSFQITGKIYATILANKLVISDGVRKPVTWDGTTFVDLTNAPVMFGQPEIYGARLFGILAANPIQIAWSEVNDLTNGYDTQTNPATSALYDNQWILGQTSQDRLYVLKATADALYFSRARSWSMLTGSADVDFRGQANREAVSNTIGCTLPDSCIFRNDEIWFQDREGYFWVIPMGGQPHSIWEGYRETIAIADKDPPATTGGRANLCCMVDWPLIPLVLATVALPLAQGWTYRIVTWNPETKECTGVWDLPYAVTPTLLGAVNDLNELHRVIMVLDENGHVMVLGTPQAGPWQDVIYSGNVAITHQITGANLGWSAGQEMDFDTITALFFAKQLTASTIGYTTPNRLTSVPQAVRDQALLATIAEIRRQVGVRGQGRWIEPIAIHSQINEQFGFEGFQVGAYYVENAPRIK